MRVAPVPALLLALRREPPLELRDDVCAASAAKAGRTFWLNPEPRLYWNYGDSVIAAYERHCTAFECWTTAQLEDFVKALTGSQAFAAPR